MTTQEFLDRYDSVSECFTEQELEDLWWNDLLDVDVIDAADEEWGKPDRWNTSVTRVVKIENRYFMIYRYAGNTEYQESYYDIQPEEVKPVEKVMVVWEAVKQCLY